MATPVLGFGERALLLNCSPDGVLGYVAALASARDRGELTHVLDVVPGAASVLVLTDGPAGPTAQALAGLVPHQAPAGELDVVDIDVVYDGEDLAEVAALAGLTAEDVVDLHSTATYTVAFCGFAPGFGYLRGLDARLHVPRLGSPRTQVPAGAVALAGGYTAVYPRRSPGGWRLIGRSSIPLFDPWRSPPALLRPGGRVRFRPVAHLPEPVRSALAEHPTGPGRRAGSAVLEVLAPGPLALLQDSGRPGHAAIAVGRSGAFDRTAHQLANRLLGNAPHAATIEALGGGLVVRALRSCTVAVTGADAPVLIDDLTADLGTPLHLSPGQVLRLGTPRRGLRSYVALRGGFDADEVLGSRSHDTLSSLGPPPLVSGDALSAGLPSTPPLVDHVPSTPWATEARLRALAGPDASWFTPQAHAVLAGETYSVSDRSDRVGVRLLGPPLQRGAERAGDEAQPRGMVRGAVQVPPSGEPVLLGPDHPVTGGYPVIAVIVEEDLDLVAQFSPGTPVRFDIVG